MGEGVQTISKKQRSERDINKGLNKAERFTLNTIESRIRNNKTESAWFVDENGLIVGKATNGTETYVMIPKSQSKPNSIMTHNHPGVSLSDSMAGRIGRAFSSIDVNMAIEANLKEIRAVTPTYTYSLKRPKKGWGDKKEINKALTDMNVGYTMDREDYLMDREDYLNDRGSRQYLDRAAVVYRYRELKKVADRFGWKLTRKKTA